MKLCQNCGQMIAEKIITCPSCGSEVIEGRRFIDDYRIEKVLHEGYSSILCKGRKEGAERPVMIRIFTPQSGVDQKIAKRLQGELEELKKLPEDYFVRHLDIRKSSDGLWYRISEWIDAENWGAFLSSGRLQDYRFAFRLFSKIASILEGLHQIGHFIPHLILDDIMLIKDDREKFEVKIDYKLSRFLNPRMDRPGPMLKKLLTCHPDIINQRPLDFRSDIWSLGKIFIELLTADFDTHDFAAKIDELPLPQEVAVLFRVMLAEDPGLRPPSMAEVAKILSQVDDKDIEKAKNNHIESTSASVKQIKGLKKRITLLGGVLAALGLLIGGLAWFYIDFRKSDKEAILINYANQYAGSVAFVMVDYRLYDGETVAYQNRTEGTAFLVDMGGFLLTNRHVACPWLEDSELYIAINMLRRYQRPLRLAYQAFLWFEGKKAFKRLPGLSGSSDLEDIYFLDLAFSTQGNRRLIISGVAKSPTQTWQLVKSPLKDDFAVFKIDHVPEGLKPLPMDLNMDSLKIPRLSPVMTLGFPLGSSTQETTVNVSVTQGRVRRTFENMIQVDTSIHSGNSGGPLIDIHGKVVGIASGVALGWTVGPVPVATPLSDIGMILPITKAAKFIQDLKEGQIKWNGVLDLSLETKLKQIKDQAKQGKWDDAKSIADKELQFGLDPTLVMAAGIMHFCAEDHKGARKRFEQALSMDDENTQAKLMLFIIDWLAGKSSNSKYRKELLALNWRSAAEFSGHLVKIMEGLVDAEAALKRGYTEGEKSWLHYVVGLIYAKQGDWAASETALRQAILTADIDDWLFFTALAGLEKVQHQRLDALTDASEKARYQVKIKDFTDTVKKNVAVKSEQRIVLAPLLAKLKQDSIGPEEKQVVLEQILEKDPDNGEILLALAFTCAMNEKWERSLECAQNFLNMKGRENAGRLSIGLLEAEVFHNMGHNEKAKARLEDYFRRTKDPWYSAISEHLLAKRTEQSLSKKAAANPENLVTWHTALGFWAEGSGEKNKAINHYKEALGSYMDIKVEYHFAKERIKRLRMLTE